VRPVDGEVRVMRTRAVAFLAVVLALASMAPARAEHHRSDPPLRFGVYPGNTFTFGKYVGATGTNSTPPDSDLALQRIVELADGRPFDVHLYAQWDRDNLGELDPLIAKLHEAGLRPNVALKYVPPVGHDGDVRGFAAWVAASVETHPDVAVWQITNEANVGVSPDSDGSAKDPIGALIDGVIAAAAVKGDDQEIGFNWLYHLDPVSDRTFWSTLATRGGPAFRAALDFAGVDIYSGTYVNPGYSLDDEGDFRRALDYVRNRMMPLAGLGADVPIYVQETGYPTLGPARTAQHQADALRGYITATRGFNVGLLQWFQLADADSTLGDGWGLLDSHYVPKPAFEVMRTAG
jgi:hypothetical protein